MPYPVRDTALAALGNVAAGVSLDAFDDPTPCSQWTVAQVLYHAAGDQHAWAASVGDAATPAYNPFDPPRNMDEGVDAVVGEAISAATVTWAKVGGEWVATPLPPVPTLPPAIAAAACALDAAVHAWDVAVATRQPSPLTAELAEQLTPAAQATADSLRGFAYAAALSPQPDDDAAAALLRYLGRDPHWAPSTISDAAAG